MIWATFVCAPNEATLDGLVRTADARPTRYRVDDVVRVTGPRAVPVEPGWAMARIEDAAPFLPADDATGQYAPVFRGVTAHLFYTGREQRRQLERSRGELEPSPRTVAVLIPIAKAATWWNLAQDQRLAHFQASGDQPGHTAIGLPYVDRVFRRLYHCRYAGPASPYDFLTYFEFDAAHTADFRRLTAELRDQHRNPEWSYVTLEFEIWLSKQG